MSGNINQYQLIDGDIAMTAPIHGERAGFGVLVEMLEFLQDQLPSVSCYVESNALEIVEQFKQLAHKAEVQSVNMGRVVEGASAIEMGGVMVPYEQSAEILYEPLSEAIEKILQVSKLAMSMVITISKAAENITRAQECIDQVQLLTRQTNMLAMNTQIEAARAGESGSSFRIIAQEVKALSENIKSLSQQMQEEVRQVAISVHHSSQVVEDMAHYDMAGNLELKDRIDALIQSMMKQNSKFTLCRRKRRIASAV